MYKFPLLASCLWASFATSLHAQTLYVDALHGRSDAPGTLTNPLVSLEKAVALAHDFTGSEPVVIKVCRGLYVLTQPLELKTQQPGPDTASYSLEAATMPDDPAWQPNAMPVIQSVSANNSTAGFPHAVGLLVAKSHVTVKGLKFVGNANPAVQFYYPLTRENPACQELTVSQCYFIGDRNATSIQGAVWVAGTGLSVDHTIFYGCRNALIMGSAIKQFSLNNSIIYGAYEAAMWFRPQEDGFKSFVFQHNLVANCAYFWIISEKPMPKLSLCNSVITGVAHYLGTGNMTLTEARETTHQEEGVRKTGTIQLSEVTGATVPLDYLNPVPASAGYNLGASLFKVAKH